MLPWDGSRPEVIPQLDELRIVGISASPRHGNTEILVKEALDAARLHEGVATEFVSLAGKKIQGCSNCRACIKKGRCILKDDWEELFRPLVDPVPDGVIFGAPVYFYSLNSQARCYMERSTSLLKGLFFPECATKPPDWTRTAGGAVTVGYDRNGGQEHALTAILQWFLINGFVTVGGGHLGYVGAPGWQMGGASLKAVAEDENVGLPSARTVGIRVAMTAMMLKAGAPALGELARSGSPGAGSGSRQEEK